jgi:hypothetical protein
MKTSDGYLTTGDILRNRSLTILCRLRYRKDLVVVWLPA